MSLERKLKRRRLNEERKSMRKTLKRVKKLVKCNLCDRVPTSGDKIDDWTMSMSSGSITLVCPDCEAGT